MQNGGKTSFYCAVLEKQTLCLCLMLYHAIDKFCIENLTRLEVAVSCQWHGILSVKTDTSVYRNLHPLLITHEIF